jgi:anthranilate synthase component 1
MPDIYLVKSEKLIVYDNFNQTMQAIYNANPLEMSYEEALTKIDEIQSSIDQSTEYEEISYSDISGQIEFMSNFTKDEYISSVKRIKEYIKDGDAMQVVLAQDFYSSFDGDSFELYCALRKINPSPYMYYLNLDECEVVGSSPEILVRLEEDDITLRPIAGTRKRGQTKEEDKNNELDLLSDPKELAEHLMLIDLGRNDVGRISKIGSVKLTEKMVIERYSHVMHIVSNVEGKLSKGLTFIDALKATLPAGTLSGAPKIRAMEIINELEPSSRGIYGGAIGYISWNGNIDTAIAIRTAVIKDKKIHVGAGAGIVADSDPEKEWQECVQKSKAFLDAMEMIS